MLCRLLSITRLETFFLFSHTYAALVMWYCYTICIIKSNNKNSKPGQKKKVFCTSCHFKSIPANVTQHEISLLASWSYNPYLNKLVQMSTCHSESSCKFGSHGKAQGRMHADRRVLDTATPAGSQAMSECTALCCIW